MDSEVWNSHARLYAQRLELVSGSLHSQGLLDQLYHIPPLKKSVPCVVYLAFPLEEFRAFFPEVTSASLGKAPC